jgi:hypothetical protein
VGLEQRSSAKHWDLFWPQVFRLFPSIVQRNTGDSLNDSYTGMCTMPGCPSDEMLNCKQDPNLLDIRFLRKPVDNVMAHVEWDHGITVSDRSTESSAGKWTTSSISFLVMHKVTVDIHELASDCNRRI